jgi:hypothetical protein
MSPVAEELSGNFRNTLKPFDLVGFFESIFAGIAENSTFAVPKGKINRKTQRSGRAVYCTGLENRRRESVRGFESLLLC